MKNIQNKMNQSFAITKGEIHIRFSYEKEDIDTGYFMDSKKFEYLSFFNKHLKKSKNIRKAIIIKIDDFSDETTSGIIMWFVCRILYNTSANESIYKKTIDSESGKGYNMAKETFEANRTKKLKNFLFNKNLKYKFIKV